MTFFGIEAGIDRRDEHKAAHEEAARNQKHHRQRNFRDRQEAPHMLAAALASTLAALFDVPLQVGRHCQKRGRQSKRQRGGKRQQQRKRQNRASNMNRTDLGHLGRQKRPESPDNAARKQHTGKSAEQSQQSALGKQLPDNTGAPCPQRDSHCNFSTPRSGPRQKQIRNVGAREQ